MKIKFAICYVALAALAGTVEAGGGGRHHGSHRHHGGHSYHGSVGVWIGAPIVLGAPYYYPSYPRYYYSPSYYPPAYSYPPYAYRYGPPAAQDYGYEERGAASAVEPPPPNWYYCREAQSYYPHVQQCPGGWEEVPAKPPAVQR